ncbi:MAG: DUF2061 domain-containing protein [Verrucomicrobiae bacterium]|nr:DUF2061 domain-containing protein [Verrucomicrobiae bacterium]
MVERSHRSLLKAISYRLTGTVWTIVVWWFVTGRARVALSIGFVELFTKIGIYYVHERIWNRIELGRVRSFPGDYQI